MVYDCHDLLAGFDGIAPEILAAEDRLLRTSDRLVFSSAYLMETMLEGRPFLKAKAALIRNAVNPEDFPMGAARRETAARRIVGYVGAMDRWFDADAVMEAAREHPSLEFVLIGSVDDPAVLRLAGCPNVRFAGEVSHAELRHHMAAWTVATIPFLRTPLTLAANPIKVYEYFSAGLPVVGMRLPELELFGDLVYLADTRRQFAALIGAAVGETDRPRSARRQAVASRETWTQRANSLLSLVDSARPESR
jgi:glycosyltransferase involved in cell wall biosynthesis